MFGFLLQRHHFVYLKNYLDFLVLLPPVLELMKNASVTWRQQGHTLVTPPDATRLKVLSSFSVGYLSRLAGEIQQLDRQCDNVISAVNIFFEELRAAIRNAPGKGMQMPVNSLDHRKFTLFASDKFIALPPTNVDGLLHELALRLIYLGSDVGEVKNQVRELHLDIHTIFFNFIDTLALDMCRCHRGQTKLDNYNFRGGVFLPGMKQMTPKAQLVDLEKIYRQASSAINNMNDFLFGLRYFSDSAGRELIARNRKMNLGGLVLKLSGIRLSVAEIDVLSEQIKIWSKA
ncbi:hypothetical protein [Pseudomonas arsenicoxydans]|uniref:Uncharacterized protein n=1 Tax=Pseudomonas arsenicoxydans TaxID=702115 RepID=A0A4P6FZZ9_9PSED|nr:hypothetical protein [Pseudomonas arsenicoxydans]QAY82572.1 hypothetical protein CUN61_00715 [Pseudomonas arsenicoxydans]